jgi:hypothetical protein
MKTGTACIKKQYLSKEQIQEIRKLYSTGEWSHNILSKKYGVSKHQIRKAVKGVLKRQPTVEQRFWSKVKKGNPNECWQWMAGKTSNGYGTFKYNGKTVNAHKFAYEITNGVCVPSRFHVCHSCNEPSCVNPNHLLPGTPKSNVQGMIESGHQYIGGPKPKLNEVQSLEVIFFNDLGIKHLTIAMLMGVRGSTVKRALEKDSLELRNQWLKKERKI